MQWVYILKCKGGFYYVGETRRLYRRFWEHLSGIGSLNTSIYEPEEIVALYKVETICKFFDYNEYVSKIKDGIWYEDYKIFKLRNFNDNNEDIYYDNLYAENTITECLMIHNGDNWDKIRGGKYTRFDVKYQCPKNELINDLPLCNCGLPCDIKKNEENNYLFFRCPKKNMWGKMMEVFDICEEPCKFYMEYKKDEMLRLEKANKLKNRSDKIKELFKQSSWLKHIEFHNFSSPNQCIGGCNRTSNSIKLKYRDELRNLCFDCFIDKNEELSNKFNISEDICLLKVK